MFRIVGRPGKDLCDRELSISRRDVLRVGGIGMMGLSLGGLLKLKEANAASRPAEKRGWNKAKKHHHGLPSRRPPVIWIYGTPKKMSPTM